MTTPRGPKLEVVVPSEDMDHVAIAATCIQVAQDAGIHERELRIYGRPLSMLQLGSQLKGRKTFLIEGNRLQAHLACITDYGHGLLTVLGLESLSLDRCAGQLAKASPLISCRWIDAEYDHWQNAEDPLLYQVAGRSMEGLPMKSNSLPPPLDQMIVNISRNPGRRILRDGYVEAVGHRMWLGPEFFHRVPGVNWESLTSESWLKATERPDRILELVAQDEPFVDDSAAELQNRLRRSLFPMAAVVD